MKGGWLFIAMHFMKKINKVALTLTALTASVAIATTGAFAFFIDNVSNSDISAKAGNVSIDVSDFDVSNKSNFNPGDENPETSLPAGHRPGTDHKLSYTVTNNGNKSVSTRSVIDISVYDKNQGYKDPSVFTLYQTAKGETTPVKIEDAADSLIREEIKIGQRLYVLNDGTVTETKPNDPTSIKSLRYIVLGPVLNGSGEDAEVEPNISENTATVSYAAALDYSTPNDYQGCPVDFDVSVQALQYRNTNISDWQTIFTDHTSAFVG